MNRTIRSTARTLNETYIGLSATVEEYHRMGEQVTNHVRCELLRGRIVKRVVATPAHRYALHQLVDCIRPFITAEFVLDVQGPITLADSEPEPDLCITIGPDSRYDARHAGTGEIVLLVEVSDTSLAYDRGEKLQIYAEAKITGVLDRESARAYGRGLHVAARRAQPDVPQSRRFQSRNGRARRRCGKNRRYDSRERDFAVRCCL